MQDVSPLSPEERAKRGDEPPKRHEWYATFLPGGYGLAVVKRTAVGVFNNGFMYAGNLAYLALLTVFPFFIVAAAIASLLGQNAETVQGLATFLATLPHDVATLLRQPILDVLKARQGTLLWVGALVGLWSVASFIETLRDIFRRAYGVKATRGFFHYRLSAMAVTVGSVILAMLAFLVQGLLSGAEAFVERVFPFAGDAAQIIGVSRVVPALVMFGALYAVFYSVTPSKYRLGKCRKWPGALFTTLWWTLATAALPAVLATLGGYSLTYGSLAGVIVTLLFFYLVGLGIAIGAHLNAALAESDYPGVERRDGEVGAAGEAATA